MYDDGDSQRVGLQLALAALKAARLALKSQSDLAKLEGMVDELDRTLEAWRESPAATDRPTCITNDAPCVDWQSFVAEHPELAPEPLRFTDDELVVAVAEVERQWDARGRATRRGAYAHCVAGVLHGFPILAGGPMPKGDVIRVGKALARLGREGRLVAASRPWEGKQWTLPEAAW